MSAPSQSSMLAADPCVAPGDVGGGLWRVGLDVRVVELKLAVEMDVVDWHSDFPFFLLEAATAGPRCVPVRQGAQARASRRRGRALKTAKPAPMAPPSFVGDPVLTGSKKGLAPATRSARDAAIRGPLAGLKIRRRNEWQKMRRQPRGVLSRTSPGDRLSRGGLNLWKAEPVPQGGDLLLAIGRSGRGWSACYV